MIFHGFFFMYMKPTNIKDRQKEKRKKKVDVILSPSSGGIVY